jgi:hypothetical protein
MEILRTIIICIGILRDLRGKKKVIVKLVPLYVRRT